MLVDATIALVDERDAADITITDIVKRAGVTRPTFYQYFGDLPSVFSAAAMQRLQPSIDSCKFSSVPVGDRLAFFGEFLLQITRTLAYYRTFYRRIIDCPAGLTVFEQIREVFSQRLRNESPLASRLNHSELSADVTCRAVAAGALSIAIDWIQQSEHGTPEGIAEEIRIFVTESIIGGLCR